MSSMVDSACRVADRTGGVVISVFAAITVVMFCASICVTALFSPRCHCLCFFCLPGRPLRRKTSPQCLLLSRSYNSIHPGLNAPLYSLFCSRLVPSFSCSGALHPVFLLLSRATCLLSPALIRLSPFFFHTFATTDITYLLLRAVSPLFSALAHLIPAFFCSHALDHPLFLLLGHD